MIYTLIILLIIFIFLILHTYIFYPIILALAAHSKAQQKKDEFEKNEFYPHISMVVSAYNEDKNINKKIENFLSLDYPPEKIELLIGSDGSTDKTSSLTRSFENERVRLFDFAKQRGKAAVLNDVVKNAKGEIILFSDAETEFEKNAVFNLTRHFSDRNIGGVCGKLELYADENSLIEEGSYWRYENFLKKKESQIKSVVSINGQIFAIRKGLFEDFPVDIITEDQILGMKILSRGYNIKFDPYAIAKEKIGNQRHEFRRRIRISAGNFQSIAHFYDLLKPNNGFISFALWCHKILRWLVPFFIIGILTISFILPKIKFIGIILLMFLILLILNHRRKNKLLALISYFGIMNLAILIGFFKFLFRKQKSAWKS